MKQQIILERLGNKRLCACGCGEMVFGWNPKLNKPIKYIWGHSQKKNPIIINKQKEQVLIGSLLGDGCISILNQKYYVYIEFHCSKQKNYLEWKNKYLEFHFNHYKKMNQYYINKGDSKVLRRYYKMFYPNRKKKISLEILNKLEPLGLAVWYMDDGCYNYGSNAITLATFGFGLEGNQIIKEWLKIKWDIDCKIKRMNLKKNGWNGYYLGFNVKNTNNFVALIKPFVSEISTMDYKIGLDKNRRSKFKIKKMNWRNNNKQKTNCYSLRYNLKKTSNIRKEKLEKMNNNIKKQNGWFNDEEHSGVYCQ